MTKQAVDHFKIRSGAASAQRAHELGFGEPRRSEAKAGRQRVGVGPHAD